MRQKIWDKNILKMAENDHHYVLSIDQKDILFSVSQHNITFRISTKNYIFEFFDIFEAYMF